MSLPYTTTQIEITVQEYSLVADYGTRWSIKRINDLELFFDTDMISFTVVNERIHPSDECSRSVLKWTQTLGTDIISQEILINGLHIPDDNV